MLKKHLGVKTIKNKFVSPNEDVDFKSEWTSGKDTENRSKRKKKSLDKRILSGDDSDLGAHKLADGNDVSRKKSGKIKRKVSGIPMFDKADYYQPFISKLNKILNEEKQSKNQPVHSSSIPRSKSPVFRRNERNSSEPFVDIMSIKNSKFKNNQNLDSKKAISNVQSKIDEINNYIKKRTMRRGIFKTQNASLGNHAEKYVLGDKLNDIQADVSDSSVYDRSSGTQVDKGIKTTEAKVNAGKNVKFPPNKAINYNLNNKTGSDYTLDSENSKIETLTDRKEKGSSVKKVVEKLKSLTSGSKTWESSKKELRPFIAIENKQKCKSDSSISQTSNAITDHSVSLASCATDENLLEEKIEQCIKKCVLDAYDDKMIQNIVDKIDTIEKFVYTKLGNEERAEFGTFDASEAGRSSQVVACQPTLGSGHIDTGIVKYLNEQIGSCQKAHCSKFCNETVIESLQNQITALEAFFPPIVEDDDFKDAHSFTSIYKSSRFYNDGQSSPNGDKCFTFFKRETDWKSRSEVFEETWLKDNWDAATNGNVKKFLECANMQGRASKKVSEYRAFSSNRKLLNKAANGVDESKSNGVRNEALEDAKKILNKVENLFHISPVYQVKSSNVLDGYKKDNIRNFYKYDSIKRKAIGEFRKNDKVSSLFCSDRLTKNERLFSAEENIETGSEFLMEKCKLKATENMEARPKFEKCKLKTTEIQVTATKPSTTYVSVSTNTTASKEGQFPETIQTEKISSVSNSEDKALKRLQLKMKMFEESNCLAELRAQINEIKSTFAINTGNRRQETIKSNTTAEEQVIAIHDLANNFDTTNSSIMMEQSQANQSDNRFNLDSYKTLQKLAERITENTANFEKEIRKCKKVLSSLNKKSGSNLNICIANEESANPIFRPKSEHVPRVKASKYKRYNYKRKSIASLKVNQITRIIKNIQNKITEHEKLCLSCNQHALTLIHQKLNSLNASPVSQGGSSDIIDTLHQTVNLLDNSDVSTSEIPVSEIEKNNTSILRALKDKVQWLETILACDFSSIQTKIEMFKNMCSSISWDTNVLKKMQEKIETLEDALNDRKGKGRYQENILSSSTICTSLSTVSMLMENKSHQREMMHFSNSASFFDDIPPCTYYMAPLEVKERRLSTTNWNHYESFNNGNFDSELQDQPFSLFQ